MLVEQEMLGNGECLRSKQEGESSEVTQRTEREGTGVLSWGLRGDHHGGA